MSGWLNGKRARIEGECPAVASALAAQGASLVDAGDCDIWVHIAPPPPVKLAHDLTHAEWRASLDAGLDRRFQAGFAEIMDYSRGLTFDTLTMVAGAKSDKAETLASVSRVSTSFQTRALVQGDPQTAMASLAQQVKVAEADLGDDATTLGAAALAADSSKS